MALTKKTKEEDDRLKKELESADMGKFKKIIKVAFAPPKKKPGRLSRTK